MLTPETNAVWNHLKVHPALKGFTLVGGSGLALRIQHRLSEDLDFVWTGVRLPVKRLDALFRESAEAGFSFVANDDPAALDEFEIAGMELHDHQQDCLVNNRVKVTFFCADNALARVLMSEPSIEEMAEFFRKQRDELEIEQARKKRISAADQKDGPQ